ncbi:MAG: hypothetical protein GY788_05860 [bacterium]|nr:hypothetical protein [bacterium]
MTYTEIFRRLALPLTTEYYPLKRASEEADAGRIDGEGGRIITYGKSFQNLARVEEPVFMMSVIAYAADPSISDLNGWESLKTFEGLVESPRGMKISEINLSNVVKAEKLSTITEASQALRKLAINRIDLYVDDMNAVAPILLNPEYDLYDLQGKIHVAGIMEEVPLYMYVHKKHQALAPKLSEVIKMVKSEGLIEQYRQTAFGIHDEKGD